jgi:hypothetical protein
MRSFCIKRMQRRRNAKLDARTFDRLLDILVFRAIHERRLFAPGVAAGRPRSHRTCCTLYSDDAFAVNPVKDCLSDNARVALVRHRRM